MTKKTSSKGIVKAIQRNTKKKYSSEEKIRIILDGLRGEVTIAELCRREGVNPNIYYRWSKDFMEAGKSRLTGNTLREANSNEVDEMRKENSQLKELVAELSLKNRVLKKNYDGLEKGFEEQ